MEADLRGHCERFEALGMRHPDQACYVTCSPSCSDWARDHVYQPEGDALAAKTPSGGKKSKAKGGAAGGIAKRARS
jgi:hypothetical protein